MTPSATEPAPVHAQNLGVGLASGRGLAHPVDVAVDSAGHIYILNRSNAWKDKNPRITVTSWDENVFAEIGRWGTDVGCLVSPTALTIDRDGHLHVTDEDLHTVTTFTTAGAPLHRWGTHGCQPGQLDRPSGVACDDTGHIWVVDHGNHRIQCFDPDGRHLHAFGTHGDEPGQLHLPWGLTVGPDDHLWVADWGNDRVQVFSPEGSFVRHLGTGLLRRPAAVLVDPRGPVYISDWGNDCVRVLSQDGTHLATLRGEGTMSRWAEEYLRTYPLVADSYRAAGEAGTLTAVTRFHRPGGMALGPDGRLLIADTGRHRVQVYRSAQR